MRNIELVEYGIMQDESEIRVHVCVLAKKLYMYSTRLAQELIRTRHSLYRMAPVRTPFWDNNKRISIETARGHLVPPDDLGSISYEIPEDLLKEFNEDDTTSGKGKKACSVIKHLLGSLLPSMNDLLREKILLQEEMDDMEEQIKGNDISVRISDVTIQIKCDYRGGSREDKQSTNNRITGNLFIQTHECNPNKDI